MDYLSYRHARASKLGYDWHMCIDLALTLLQCEELLLSALSVVFSDGLVSTFLTSPRIAP